MTVPNTSNPTIRVPNLPNGQIVDEKGNATDDEITFRQTLVTNLQKLFGSEGVVPPTVTKADMLTIQNNRIPDPVTGAPGQYTCQFGTYLYVTGFNGAPPLDVPVICVPDGSGNPLFKQIQLI